MWHGGVQSSADEMLRLFLGQTNEHVVILLDPTGLIVGWLGSAEKVFGYAAAEVIGQSVAMLFTPENLRAGMDKYERKVARTNVEAEDDRWMLRKDGTHFWATGTLSPVKNETGDLLGFVKLLRDRTDMRAVTESLEKQNESLQQAEQGKNRFISTLAHELRNPLAAAVNAVNLLKASEDAAHQALAIPIIERGLASMQNLVNDLLEAARAGAGKLKLNTKPQPLAPLVEAVIQSCQPHINSRVQRVHFISPEVPLIAEVDENRLQQVFVNLIENAARATRNGGTIWVKLSVEDDEAVVKVEDDGVGISPELLPRIFDLFTQAEFASDCPDAGLGIGLSVVKDITALHGGSVQVRSDGTSKGSEFTVRLPLARDHEASQEAVER